MLPAFAQGHPSLWFSMVNVVRKSLLRLCALTLWALVPAAALGAPAPALVTIADGEAQLVREATVHALAEGVRLAKEDIVETTPRLRFLRIEFADGLIVDLGPESRLLVAPRLSGERARRAVRLHLLQGVAKVTVPKSLAPAAGAFTTPLLDVNGVARSAVFIVQGGFEAQVFAESGEVQLQERQRNARAGAPVVVKGSEFYGRGADGKSSVTARPTPAFIQRLPRAFMDTLPPRAAVFASREVPPKPLGEIAYAQAEPWVDAHDLRAYFVSRWRPLAQNAAFRQGLVANLAAHPEWDRTLYPEKYLPKPGASSPAPGYGSTR